jgi:hypothetical protein
MIEMTKAEIDVFAERRRHISVEGWTPGHDDEHKDGAMALAAACYALAGATPRGERSRWFSAASWCPRLECELPASVFTNLWPWRKKWFKPSSPRRDLVKAGALIIAEIERLDRAADSAKITGN